MQARGIISGGANTVSCGPNVEDLSTTCSSQVYFIGMSAIINTMHFNLLQ
jgi:hypothetical protein